MKTIDIKSVIIGVLLNTTVLFGMGATGKADAGKWDDKQVWEIKRTQQDQSIGWEPFGCDKNYVFYRRRTK